jgi:hypothetical protein
MFISALTNLYSISRLSVLKAHIFSQRDVLLMRIYSNKVGIGLLSLTVSVLLLGNSSHMVSASVDLDLKIKQSLKQQNVCADDSECANIGINSAEMIKGLKQKIYSKVNQELRQHNLCVDSECINEGYNQFTIDKMKGKHNGKLKLSQKIEQKNECVDSQCINEGANEIIANNNANTEQKIVQSNQCASGATCINSAGNVILIGNPTRYK